LNLRHLTTVMRKSHGIRVCYTHPRRTYVNDDTQPHDKRQAPNKGPGQASIRSGRPSARLEQGHKVSAPPHWTGHGTTVVTATQCLFDCALVTDTPSRDKHAKVARTCVFVRRRGWSRTIIGWSRTIIKRWSGSMRPRASLACGRTPCRRPRAWRRPSRAPAPPCAAPAGPSRRGRWHGAG